MKNEVSYEKYLSAARYDRHDDMIKSISRTIKWDKGYIALCSFNSIMFGLAAFKSFTKNESFYFSLIASTIWLIVVFITINQIKIKRLELKKNIISRDEELKKLDYKEFIKNQRKIKLKKLKSNWFS
jgi:hypothetical protein